MTQKEWVDIISPIAQRVCKTYGYLPSVLTAQTCQETGYGSTDLAQKCHNVIGMKASLLNDSWRDYTLWDGTSYNKTTIEFTAAGKKYDKDDSFRVYTTYEECLADYLLFMTHGAYSVGGIPKYADLLTEKDPETLIKAVARRGYCTDPNYPKAIMAIIDKWGLRDLDTNPDVEPAIEIEPEKPTPADDGEVETFDEPDDKPVEEVGIVSRVTNIIKLAAKKIIDITSKNKIPASRGSNKISWIVVHFLGVPNADNPYLYTVKGTYGYGGHYNIQRNGEIYLALDPRKGVCWHCGGKIQGESKDSNGVAPHRYYGKCTNWNSIGIECGIAYTGTEKDPPATSNKWYFTEATQESLVYLVSKLMDDYGIDINHVIRHFDVTGKVCPAPYFLNNHTVSSWTWDEFIANVKQYRKNGTITIPDGSKATVDQEKSEPATRDYLKKGDKSDAVRIMQEMLIACGYDCGKYGADGKWGDSTETAVRAFQKDAGLKVDGCYGPKSKAALEALYNKKKPPAQQKEVRATELPKSLDKTLSGSYKATTALNMRTGAGTSKKILTTIPGGTTVANYGYLTTLDGVKWLYVQTTLNDTVYTGFCCSTYLKKI